MSNPTCARQTQGNLRLSYRRISPTEDVHGDRTPSRRRMRSTRSSRRRGADRAQPARPADRGKPLPAAQDASRASGSPLAIYLVDGQSLIYAQGSIATSTTIVSGTEDDRFDVDAIVEMMFPTTGTMSARSTFWKIRFRAFQACRNRALHPLRPAAVSVHAHGRHDPRPRERIEFARAGEIFHSPDRGPAPPRAVQSWGFTGWFRSQVGSVRRSSPNG